METKLDPLPGLLWSGEGENTKGGDTNWAARISGEWLARAPNGKEERRGAEENGRREPVAAERTRQRPTQETQKVRRGRERDKVTLEEESRLTHMACESRNEGGGKNYKSKGKGRKVEN